MFVPGGPGPRRREALEKLKEPKPQNIREVPDYLKRVITKFFARLLYITKLVWEARPLILFVMLFMAVFEGVVPLITALIDERVLNSLASAYNGTTVFSVVLWLIVIQFSFAFVVSLINSINSMITRISAEIVTNHIKVKIMNKAQEIDLASFDLPEFYEKLENANREAGSRPMEIIRSTLSIMSSLISIISFIAVLAAVSPAAPAIIIAVSIPSAIVNFIYRSKNVDYIKQRTKDRRQMQYYSNLITNKDMVKELRMFGLSGLFIERYKQSFQSYFSGQKKLIIGEGAWHIALTVLRSVVNCFFFLYIARMVCSGVLMIGSFSLYTRALRSISSGVNTLISTTASIYEGTLFIDNMITFMNHKRNLVPLLAEPRHVTSGIGHTIVFENVSFRYPGTERDVLKNINLRLDPGDTAVLVGLNGAGKTTLIKLLTRLYDPTEGRILFDGHDIREYKIDELYHIFGIIFQDFGKYAVTVHENIEFGDISREPEEKALEDAADKSNSSDFIHALPDQFNTPLMRFFEENGVDLSIGQWQKLAIARAFYGDSDIVILDEPTASLDAMAEQEIYDQFDALRHNKTTIFVSHRLSSATKANKIIVLQNGSIIEEGDHASLMRLKGHYYTLFSTQASRYITRKEESVNTDNQFFDQEMTENRGTADPNSSLPSYDTSGPRDHDMSRPAEMQWPDRPPDPLTNGSPAQHPNENPPPKGTFPPFARPMGGGNAGPFADRPEESKDSTINPPPSSKH